MRKISQAGVMAFAAAILLTLANGAARAACAQNNPVNVPLTNTNTNPGPGGARWELCWENDAQRKGLVLSQVTLTPKPGAPRTLILEQASLAQVLVAYDNNSGNQHLVSDAGLPLTALTAADCPGGTLLAARWFARWSCHAVTPGAARGNSKGKSLIIFGVSAAAGGGTYIHQWVFSDDGSIHAMLGVSGRLDPSRDSTATTSWPISAPTRYATNRFHTAYWRLDFALGGQSNDLFQQLDYTADGSGYMVNQTITNITSESQFNIAPGAQRFWVVKDTAISTPNGTGQNISFQIVPQHTSLHRGSDAFTSSDVYVTQNNVCEQLASHNTAAAGCGADQLTQFVNGDALSDLVVWVGTTWHQVPRAEDESAIQTHWQGFFLAPRDLTATSPL